MTTDQQVNHGVDADKLAEFAGYAAENPDEVQLGLKASSSYEGTCAHSLAKMDGYALVSLAQDVQLTVNTPTEVRADD